MLRLGVILFLASAAAGCNETSFKAGDELSLAYAAEYQARDGGGLFFEHDTEAGDDPTALFDAPNFVPAFGSQPALSELLGYPLIDCSDRNHRCLQIVLHAVLAIPRQGIASDASFEFAGAKFDVVCDDASCRSALIRSECAFWERTQDGEPVRCMRNDAGDVSDGHAVTYLFERDRGVVLIHASTACKSPLSPSICADENTLVLQTGVGLLGPAS